MTSFSRQIESVLGIDVSKDTVTLHDLATGRRATVPNTRAALTDALEAFAGCELAVCEATGGYEDTLLAVLAAIAIPAHRADGARVKAFLRSCGRRAKTDAIDAEGLALFGRERGAELPRWRPAAQDQAELVALVERRRDLVVIRVAEKNRRSAPRSASGSDLVREDIEAHIAELDRRIDVIDTRIARLVAENAEFAARAKVLRSVPGIGPTIAPFLLAGMPELGSLSQGQAASLAGLAPHPRQSGKTDAHRTTRGGRRFLRPPLFLAALAVLKTDSSLAHFYKRLLAAGKPKRLALVALMRKIIVIANARLRDLAQQRLRLT
jgi:transposase